MIYLACLTIAPIWWTKKRMGKMRLSTVLYIAALIVMWFVFLIMAAVLVNYTPPTQGLQLGLALALGAAMLLLVASVVVDR